MSNASSPSVGSDAAGSHFTVEDAGTTTDASDLTNDESVTSAAQAVQSSSDVPSDPGAPQAPGAPEAPGAPSSRITSGDDLGHVFDQTNGVVEGLDGDSDGTADSDDLSSAERGVENPAFEAHTETEPQREGGVDDSRITGN